MLRSAECSNGRSNAVRDRRIFLTSLSSVSACAGREPEAHKQSRTFPGPAYSTLSHAESLTCTSLGAMRTTGPRIHTVRQRSADRRYRHFGFFQGTVIIMQPVQLRRKKTSGSFKKVDFELPPFSRSCELRPREFRKWMKVQAIDDRAELVCDETSENACNAC